MNWYKTSSVHHMLYKLANNVDATTKELSNYPKRNCIAYLNNILELDRTQGKVYALKLAKFFTEPRQTSNKDFFEALSIYFDKYLTLKNRRLLKGPKSDINFYKRFEDFHNILDEVEAELGNKKNIHIQPQKEVEEEENSTKAFDRNIPNKLITYQDDNVIVARANNENESRILGNGLGPWCTARKKGNLFYMYRFDKQETMYYVYFVGKYKDFNDSEESVLHFGLDSEGEISYTDRSNAEETETLSWLIEKFPELEQAYDSGAFEYIPLTKQEIKIHKLGDDITLDQFKTLTYDERLMWLQAEDRPIKLDIWNELDANTKNLYVDSFADTEEDINPDIFKAIKGTRYEKTYLNNVKERVDESLEDYKNHQVPASTFTNHELLFLPPEIKSAAFRSWKEKIIYNVYNYKECPEEFKNLPEIKDLALSGWTKKVRSESTPEYYYKQCPEEFKNLPEILEARRKGWIALIENNPDNLLEKNSICPEYLKPELLEYAKETWIKKIHQNPSEYSLVPLEFRSDPEMQEAIKASWVRRITGTPSYYEDCPQEFQNLPEIQEAYKQGWILHIEHYPYDYRICPIEEIKNLPEVKTKVINFWIAKINNAPSVFYNSSYFPPELKNIPEIKETFRKRFVAEVERDPNILMNRSELRLIPQEFQNLPEVKEAFKKGWYEKIKKNPSSGMYMCPEEFQDLPEFKELLISSWIKTLIAYPDDDYPRCPEKFRNLPEIQEAYKQGWIKKMQMNKDPNLTYYNYKKCPEQFKNLPEIQTVMKKYFAENPLTQPVTQPVTASRLYSSIFNDNYIGIVNSNRE